MKNQFKKDFNVIIVVVRHHPYHGIDKIIDFFDNNNFE